MSSSLQSNLLPQNSEIENKIYSPWWYGKKILNTFFYTTGKMQNNILQNNNFYLFSQTLVLLASKLDLVLFHDTFLVGNGNKFVHYLKYNTNN